MALCGVSTLLCQQRCAGLGSSDYLMVGFVELLDRPRQIDDFTQAIFSPQAVRINSPRYTIRGMLLDGAVMTHSDLRLGPTRQHHIHPLRAAPSRWTKPGNKLSACHPGGDSPSATWSQHPDFFFAKHLPMNKLTAESRHSNLVMQRHHHTHRWHSPAPWAGTRPL